MQNFDIDRILENEIEACGNLVEGTRLPFIALYRKVKYLLVITVHVQTISVY